MSFDDFMQEFNEIQMCHQMIDCILIGYEDLNENFDSTWKQTIYNSKWIRDSSEVDSGLQIFWTNPQFLIQVFDSDGFYEENKVTLIVELMQKCARFKEKYIGVHIFKVF